MSVSEQNFVQDLPRVGNWVEMRWNERTFTGVVTAVKMQSISRVRVFNPQVKVTKTFTLTPAVTMRITKTQTLRQGRAYFAERLSAIRLRRKLK